MTQKRTAQDYAERLRALVDVDYRDATCIRVVQDNLSTHTPGALYEAFPTPEAHRILERLEFHYTPKHASWLNMVEIQMGCSRASAWTGASTTARSSSARSPLGSAGATPPAHA